MLVKDGFFPAVFRKWTVRWQNVKQTVLPATCSYQLLWQVQTWHLHAGIFPRVSFHGVSVCTIDLFLYLWSVKATILTPIDLSFKSHNSPWDSEEGAIKCVDFNVSPSVLIPVVFCVSLQARVNIPLSPQNSWISIHLK